MLVLFDRSDEGGPTPDWERTTVDPVAFGVHPGDFNVDTEGLAALGYDLTHAYHDWVDWRSLYLHDPDGNEVELVCYDPENCDK